MPQLEGYKKIVLPVDYSIETKQKTMQTLNMAKMFDATVYLYKQKGIDDINQSKIDLNAQFIKRYLKEQDIPFVEEQQAKATVDFDKDFIQYAKEVEANLIIILTTKEKELIEFVLGPVEQKVINNKEEIPVMCIHPLQNLYKTERLSSMINLSF
jgi:nucleotide-binding universal stress UspA family protein